ncbi:MAG: hypothetical protein KBC35_03250 [Candidatus Pacebacteria bacterium]|nr:hypothetical protein [Candidatus Paceibacterota bacterium]
MTLTKDLTAKFAVAIVAVAMVFSAFVSAAKAEETTEDLQAMINDLLAQVAALQSQAGQGATTAAGVCPYTWTRDLNVGATGADVKMLQQFLNADADTRVAAEGAGSVGMETETYGPMTAAAVSKLQVKYRADILSPANLVNPTGYFGPSTRAKANGLCVAPAAGEEEEEGEATEEEEEEVGELQGEASLDNFDIEDADEADVEEADEEIAVAEVTVEFTDGDAEISRLDLAFTDSEGTDSDPWDVFESFSVWVDGDKVAETSASDEDDYLGNENLGILRFSDLGVVGMEDEEVVITVAATINANLEAAELGEWDVDGVAVRFFDADGVATTDDTTPVTDDTATFNIEVEGAGDDLDMKASSNDPDATTLALDEDDTTEHEIFIFELDADDSDGDVTLENVTINLALSSTTRALNEVVKDVMITIDGESFSAEDFDGAGDWEAVDFDVDGDVTIAAGEAVDVVVTVEFEDMDGDSNLQGVTVTATSSTTDVDAEGESGEAVVIGGSDQNGNPMTLRSEGLVLEITSIDEEEDVASYSGDTDTGTYTFEFEVTAFGEDFYMDEDADVVNFQVLVDDVAAPAGSSTATLDISGADDAATADYMIAEGESATFTLTVETGSSVAGSVKVIINSVDYSADDNASEELNVLATPADDWTSSSLILN